MEVIMVVFKTILFLCLSIGGFIFAAYNLMEWSIKEVSQTLLLGAVFVGVTIWCYP
jgi:hypothetical protein